MYQVDIKPLTVNQAWKGRRFKTAKYVRYEKSVYLLLPDMEIPYGPLTVYYEFGVSYAGSDWDNPIKPFQDILQKRYEFNDSRIMEAVVKKVVVKKGQEYIKYRIEGIDQ